MKSQSGISILIVLFGLIVGSLTGYFGASLLASLHFVNNGESKNGWSYFLTFGRNEPPSLAAAAGAKHGMFAHLSEEAVYFIWSGNASSNQAYVLHFDDDEYPPVDAFWSLTMYYDELPNNLVENPIDRYVISDRTPGIQLGEDGGLDIYIQHEAPNGSGESNWLPAPDGPFTMLLRTYITGESIRNGSYAPPPIVPVGVSGESS